MTKKHWWTILLIVSLIPFKTTTVPEWRVRYIDKKGRPFASLPVEQTWQNYSAEASANYLRKETDQQGYIKFPKHEVWAPLLVRFALPIINVLSSGINAGFGPTSWLVTSCNVLHVGDGAVYDGNDLPSTVVLGFFDFSGQNKPDASSTPPQCTIIEAQAKDASNSEGNKQEK